MVIRDPGDRLAGKLLPPGQPSEELDVPGLGRVECSLVDAGNPEVLVNGATVGIDPSRGVGSVNGDVALLERLQRVRSAASVAMGLVKHPEDAWAHSPMVPFLVMIW